MKKIVIVLAALLAAAVLLGGCVPQEPSATLVLKDAGTLAGSAEITVFQNAILPGVDGKNCPEGYEFLGWAPEESATEPLYAQAGLARYADLKDYLTGTTVTLYAVYGEVQELPAPDLVLGWYAKSATSGLTQQQIDKAEPALLAYLTGKGVDTAGLTVQWRGYDGDVAAIGAAINGDGDVDVLVGVGKNITSTGKVETLDLLGDILMGGKSRYIARLTEKDLAVLAYEWLQTPEAAAALA